MALVPTQHVLLLLRKHLDTGSLPHANLRTQVLRQARMSANEHHIRTCHLASRIDC